MTQRRYTIDEIDEMRVILSKTRPCDTAAAVEDKLRTCMVAGIGVEELQAKLDERYAVLRLEDQDVRRAMREGVRRSSRVASIYAALGRLSRFLNGEEEIEGLVRVEIGDKIVAQLPDEDPNEAGGHKIGRCGFATDDAAQFVLGLERAKAGR